MLLLFALKSDHWMLKSIFTKIHRGLIMSVMAVHVHTDHIYMFVLHFILTFLSGERNGSMKAL